MHYFLKIDLSWPTRIPPQDTMLFSIFALVLVVRSIHADIIAVSSPPSAFSGAQSGIGSWFYTDADGTNGNSWCGYPYNDGMPIFAPVSLLPLQVYIE